MRQPAQWPALLASFVLVAAALLVSTPSATAAENTCRARNLTQDTPARSNLQTVLDTARAGDSIAVRYVCVGSFQTAKRLTLVGKPAPGVPTPLLTSDGAGRVLRVAAAKLWLHDLRIMDGDATGDGGGVLVETGTKATLIGVAVQGNQAGESGGGIFAEPNGVVVLKGSTTVSGNAAGYAGGGVMVDGGDLVLRGTASISDNTGVHGGGAAAWSDGTVTMYDASLVDGNSAVSSGGGIFSYGRDADGDRTAVTMNDASFVTGNTSDADDDGFGSGGGIYGGCGGYLTGAVADGNVDANMKGVDDPVENNVHYIPCG